MGINGGESGGVDNINEFRRLAVFYIIKIVVYENLFTLKLYILKNELGTKNRIFWESIATRIRAG